MAVVSVMRERFRTGAESLHAEPTLLNPEPGAVGNRAGSGPACEEEAGGGLEAVSRREVSPQ